MILLRYIISIAFISDNIITNSGVHCYPLSPPATSRTQRWRPSLLHLRRVVRWQPTTASSSRLSSNFYDDFEDFGEFSSKDSNAENGGDGSEIEKTAAPTSGGGGDDDVNDVFSDPSANENAVMRELRARMIDLSNQRNDEDNDDEEEEDEEPFDDVDSGSALPDLEGNTISNVDDLIRFAQARVHKKSKKINNSEKTTGGTWEDENWAKPVPHMDDTTGEILDLNNLLQGGVVLVANPAKFCSDVADEKGKGKRSFLGGLFDDPFPTGAKENRISPALLAKFGITMPPSPDLGPDRRADLLPVVLLIERNPMIGCKAALLNRRTGNLMGDLPPSIFGAEAGDNSEDGSGNEFSPHPLSAFMIQPLWWAGSSPGTAEDKDNPLNRSGLRNIDMVHACPYVNNCVPLAKSDGLYWGGDPIQAQEAMKDSRLEKPLSGFDFKFFIQTTRWLPDSLEQEIKDGTWFLTTVSKEVLFRSRDRLGLKRAKPLWTEIIELMGDDYRHIRDLLYGEEDE